ncbi:MAG: TonB-dependent receptor plug domain-containing protein, partial [Pseudomonadota bacterium]
MNDQHRFSGVGLTSLAMAAVVGAPLSASAQADTDAAIGEIIVTAQKREQRFLAVPVTVNVFSAADIEKTGALNLSEIEDYVPGLEVGDGATQAPISIRGVSSVNISTGGDPSVATFYDEVYLPRAALQMSFSDLARVEVLKGPQGTLYGRNAAAGVVNMVPNQPAAENEGFVRARVGNYSLFRIEGMGNLALSDEFMLRANVLSNQRDGYLTNVTGGAEPGT